MIELVLVFGSNLAGRHGKGVALEAKLRWGAQPGVGKGRTGRAYAIPTKDGHRFRDPRCQRVLPLEEIAGYVAEFLDYARQNLNTVRFHVSPLGTGLAGYSHTQIAPMFRDAPVNCHLPGEWVGILWRSQHA